ncbi:hypothetical protein EV401DRAFT_1523541 [Pisolithus croceorrhizus]|nr:hypothetical protein EV401DRAFT_1523541 [Pisolithus croceorrhizus]
MLTSLRIYVSDVAAGKIEPTFTYCPSYGLAFPCNFLEEVWDLDIFPQEGFAHTLRSIMFQKLSLQKCWEEVEHMTVELCMAFTRWKMGHRHLGFLTLQPCSFQVQRAASLRNKSVHRVAHPHRVQCSHGSVCIA